MDGEVLHVNVLGGPIYRKQMHRRQMHRSTHSLDVQNDTAKLALRLTLLLSNKSKHFLIRHPRPYTVHDLLQRKPAFHDLV